MKRSDIAMIVFIASISVLVAFVVASSIPVLQTSPKGEKVDTISSISSQVTVPDPKVFNSASINPTVETVIGSHPAPGQ